MVCRYRERTAISPGNGKPINRCRLVSDESGRKNIWIPVSHCAGCSRADDGSSHASKAIIGQLKGRIVQNWNKEPCVGCGGSSLTVEAALIKLKQRIGAQEAGRVLVQAVENGMPAKEAERLAKKCLPETIDGVD